MKIGIFGGTFDPFHVGHYAIVKNALANLVDKVIVVPSSVNYYRKEKNSFFHNKSRLDILEKWFENDENVIIEPHEYAFQVETEHRYIDTLRYVIEKYDKEFSEKNQYFTIIGGDSYNNFKTWYKWDEIVSLSELIVVKRDEELKNDIKFRVLEIGNDYKDISASRIRDSFISNNSTVETLKREYMNIIEKQKKEFEIEKTVVKTPIFDLVKVENENYPFEPVRIKSKDWVLVIIRKENKFLMVKQMRYGINKEMVEFPCGMVEEGEEPIQAAQRELKEETGYEIEPYEFQYLGFDYANPAFMNNKMHYFYVNLDDADGYNVGETDFDEHENLVSSFVEMNEVKNAKDVSVFMKCALYRLEDCV